MRLSVVSSRDKTVFALWHREWICPVRARQPSASMGQAVRLMSQG